jgi:hypothetical protein
MTQKRKLVTAAVVLMALCLAIFTSGKLFGGAAIEPLQGNSNPSPTIVVTQLAEPQSELAWDCPGCPGG